MAAGPSFELSEVSRAAAFGDIDNDGDMDVVLTNNNGPARLLLNEVGNRHQGLFIRLEGVAGNRDGFGARVALLRAGRRPLWRRSHSDGSYLSASDPRVHFGLGDSDAVESVGVVWPSGRRELWRDIHFGKTLRLREASGEPWPKSP